MTEQVTLQKALYTIKKLKQMLQDQKPSPIAIVGLSCRFPQAVGKDAYWKMLSEGKNVLSRMPEERWDLLKNTHEITLRDKEHPYYGGFLSSIPAFDPYFFGISPREAIRMDPQHRLLLEVAYEAIEDAGLTVEDLAGSNTGVFSSLYVSQLAHMQRMDNEMDALYLPTGNAISIAANRISYLFDLRGPSVIVDSACSSSMASLYLACLNLQNKSCDMALVCGAKLNLLPYVNFVLTKAKMLSPDGQCKTFDAGANGYAQGEGVGVIVLKPLNKALQDKDRIYGVIMGSAVNQDGKTNGLTAPNGLQQEALIKAAHRSANINPENISYVECHGTGTFLGDPIEIQALGEVVGKNRDNDKPCWIGSVKTNIGHLEPAAGIASIIKVALSLYHKKIPAHLNYHTPNPHIPFNKYHFAIPTKMQDWPLYGPYRLAGMSGFGFGGTNAHVMMREITADELTPDSPISDQTEIFTLSAKDPQALKDLIKKWQDFLKNTPSLNLSQICYNLHVRRSHYTYRLAILAKNISELSEALNAVLENKKSPTIFVNFEKSKSDNKVTNIDLEKTDPKTLAEYYVNQSNIPWKKFEEKRQFHNMDLPTYAWQHKDYWPPLGDVVPETVSDDPYPLQAKAIFSPLDTLQFEFKIDNKHIPDLADTYNILHAGYYLEILAYAVNQIQPKIQFTIEDHQFLSPLIVPENARLTVQLILKKIDESQYSFHFYSNTVGQKNWVEHAIGKLILSESTSVKIDSVQQIKKRCPKNEKAPKLYEKILAMGMPAGESIRWTQQYWFNDKEILCEFQQPKFTEKNPLFKLGVHPGIIDASIQPIFKLLPDQFTKPYIASSARKMNFYGIKNPPFYLYGVLTHLEPSGEKMLGNLFLINEKNEVLAEFHDIALTQLDNKIQIEKIMEAKEKHQKIDLASLPAHERKKFVVDFLMEQIAIIFSMPKEDIEINRSLRDMGIDSLMALVLMRTLEMGLGATYSMQALLEGPTINELADFVIGVPATENKQTIPEVINPWIAFRKKQPEAQCRLFCFPYGGGGASIYREWQKELPASIEVCPIQLTGREGRMNEKPYNNLDTLIDALVDNLQSELDLPFAFFGHSFGSLIAFELTRRLRRLALPKPSHLFVSAFPDPRTPTRSLDNLLAQLKTIHISLSDIDNSASVELLSDEQLSQLSDIFNENGIADYGDHLMNREIIKVLLPIFMGDMGIVKSYQYHDEAPLDLPISVFLGLRDTWVDRNDLLKWKEHTLQTCEISEYDSGHLFIKDRAIRRDILNKITTALVREKNFSPETSGR